MARGFPAVWLIAGCAFAWQRDVAGRMAGRACTNRLRLSARDEGVSKPSAFDIARLHQHGVAGWRHNPLSLVPFRWALLPHALVSSCIQLNCIWHDCMSRTHLPEVQLLILGQHIKTKSSPRHFGPSVVSAATALLDRTTCPKGKTSG